MSGAELLVRGGLVLDGTGAEATGADVLVEGDRVRVEPAGTVPEGAVARVLDATGLVVAPGFVDVHSHADNAPFLAETDASKLLQGVTSEVVGNCGMSLAPVGPEDDSGRAEGMRRYAGRFFPPVPWGWHRVGELLAATDAAGYGTNYAPLVGHNAIRVAVMGMEERAPDAAETRAMQAHVDEAVEAGVVGLSSGLIYPPGVYASTEEVVALAQRLPADLPYVSHVRGEGRRVLDSLDEAVRVGRRADRPVQVSHLKVSAPAIWGRMPEALALLDRARAGGVRVRQDVYPYVAASTMLAASMPPWFHAGGDDAALARLRDPAERERLREEVSRPGVGWENFVEAAGWDRVVVASSATHRHDGASIAEIAADRGVEAFDAYADLLLEEELDATMVVHSMHEDDLVAALAHPETMIGSDGLPPGTGGLPHPRLHGTFPRVLRRFVTETGLLGLPEAVRRMTSLPAQTFGLSGRGTLTTGAAADLVVLDPERVADTATYEQPHLTPVGIEWVLVGGRIAVEHGRATGVRAGRRLTPSH